MITHMAAKPLNTRKQRRKRKIIPCPSSLIPEFQLGNEAPQEEEEEEEKEEEEEGQQQQYGEEEKEVSNDDHEKCACPQDVPSCGKGLTVAKERLFTPMANNDTWIRTYYSQPPRASTKLPC